MELARTNGGRFAPGISGNPSGLPGRPIGSRTKFSQGFLDDLAQVWQEHGRETMLKTAKDQPSVFFATCARLIPNDVRVTVEQQLPGNLSPADWNLMLEIIDAVKQAIPDASNRSPGAVLEHVLDALRQADARALNCLENVPSSDGPLIEGT
jgi:hypothetical protein